MTGDRETLAAGLVSAHPQPCVPCDRDRETLAAGLVSTHPQPWVPCDRGQGDSGCWPCVNSPTALCSL